MKKYLMILSIAALGYTANAQDSKLYLKGGLNLANVSTSSDGSIDNANMLPSFHAGLMADLPLGAGALSFQPGLLFSGKGSKIEIGNSNDPSYLQSTTRPYYIEMPLNLVVNLPLSDKESKFFIGGGVYGAMGIAGKYSYEGKIFGASISGSDKIEFTNDDPTTSEEEGAGLGMMKRWDYGLNGTAGFAFNNFLVSVNYGHGLAKLNSGTANSSNDNNKHRVWSLSLGISL
ncbi:PorT family protein [Flavihumibacter rivuli]|uniref:porin family protein n=1 Tax=Flavihumibacter rivuli TaxID=2838156 RepID=UPI001BDF40D5|nr:porin family protein [Flavihumibacter rivuli]ULQ55355.1 PorT family protein [Flavihumibacter rivuli]